MNSSTVTPPESSSRTSGWKPKVWAVASETLEKGKSFVSLRYNANATRSVMFQFSGLLRCCYLQIRRRGFCARLRESDQVLEPKPGRVTSKATTASVCRLPCVGHAGTWHREPSPTNTRALDGGDRPEGGRADRSCRRRALHVAADGMRCRFRRCGRRLPSACEDYCRWLANGKIPITLP